MSALIGWGVATLIASTAMLLLVLVLRVPVRRWVGPRLGYWLWAMPVIRMVLPNLPTGFDAALKIAEPTGAAAVLFIGPRGIGLAASHPMPIAEVLAAAWLVGAAALFTLYTMRHVAYCRRLRATGTAFGDVEGIPVIVADIAGPLAFGVFQPAVAVPRAFTTDYAPQEQNLALAHERAHHARGDLLANWVSLAVLAVHWWNPAAWFAIGAFRADQEFAADAMVLAGRTGTAAVYARVLVKAAGVGALPACNLNARSTLKGRLMTLAQTPRSRRRRLVGAVAVTLGAGAALAATATPGAARSPGKQVVTIGVKPDGVGGYALLIADTMVAADAPLPGGNTLPADFSRAGGCDLAPAAKPTAMVIKGSGATMTYTVMCGSAAPATVRATLAEGLTSLKTMRASVAVQESPAFPPAERTHALGAIDRSIHEVEATLSGRA